jgi:septal ring factor EnvC (AmiA/AmiB activator)
LALAALIGGSLAGAQDRRATTASLQNVRKEMKTLQARIEQQTTARDEGARALRDAELEIAARAAKLDELHRAIREHQARQRELAGQTEEANRRLGAERAALARQVRISYMNGRAELFRLLLSQESPATLGRMLVYYDYFNRARSERVRAVAADVEGLRALGAEQEKVTGELQALEARQSEALGALTESRDERKAAVANLNAGLADSSAALAKLRAEEKHLGDLVKQLSEALAGFPVDGDQPFAKLKGKLAWPIQGRIAGDFGQPRDGGPVKWNGILIEANAGAPVRSIYRGRVAFANWLPGLGLLMIIDHGGGYMSLYGHNASLAKESGDWVDPGEVIAAVGDTGGQPRPALYFEIRKNGEPLDPHGWMGRKLAAR